MYTPSRYSVKVIFPTEADIDKVMEMEEEIKDEGFEPRMSLSLKACRTIFCTNFDATLLTTYTKENIIDFLKHQKWKVEDIYIMKSNKSFKIEMTSKKQAQEFLKKEFINIGGIRLNGNSKEPEIDPTIKMCWECGQLDPNHNSQNCNGAKICIKCGEIGHKFYECSIPREEIAMSDQQKEKRYCAACKTRGTHTSMDHRQCQKKREILRERARVEREKRVAINEADNKETELIRKVININNNEEFPNLIKQNPQQSAITTILTLALIDEANNPGVFEKKIEEAYKNNGLPIVKYKLEPNTAKKFQRELCGAQIAPKPNTVATPILSRYFMDQSRQKRNGDYEESNEQISNEEKKARTQLSITTQIAAAAPAAAAAAAAAPAAAAADEMEYESTNNKEQQLTLQFFKQLKNELDKRWVEYESDTFDDGKIHSLSLEQILDIITNENTRNKKEWLMMVKALVERLIQLGHKEVHMAIRIKKVLKDQNKKQDF